MRYDAYDVNSHVSLPGEPESESRVPESLQPARMIANGLKGSDASGAIAGAEIVAPA
jgi:hypothetical protein